MDMQVIFWSWCLRLYIYIYISISACRINEKYNISFSFLFFCRNATSSLSHYVYKLLIAKGLASLNSGLWVGKAMNLRRVARRFYQATTKYLQIIKHPKVSVKLALILFLSCVGWF
jgi:hypothetical protein